MNRKSRPVGFTLIELTVVLFVIGVLMVFALPRMELTSDMRARNGLRNSAG
jgi:prepilin-type N-terminal cleavage/methylation domain-containing protein